ncbi:MAG TPA: histidine kinase [Ferruginibacter sp.]|nr:histidine kinase [Ferruginibacter sp.]HMP19979.1 histidine kinase [Ferruginibacter sp.]
MFTHRYRYWFALLLSIYTYVNTEFCRVYYYFNIRIEWYYALATILAITFLILEINSIAEPVVRRRWSPEKNKVKYKVAFFIVGSIASTTLTVAIVLIVGMLIHPFSLKENFTPLKLNLMYAWLVNLLYHLINTIIFYFKEYKTTSLEAEQLKSITAQAEIQLLKNQINPHFLFNNLNVLSALILKDNNEANRFIEAFSKVYRYILTTHDKELVELKTELDFIRPYIFLLQKRFAGALEINISIDEKKQHQYIIPASLQMLIENAIKHNIVSRNKPLTIAVHTNGDNTIVVTNNLQAKQSVEYSTGIGLQNIIKRYRLVSNRDVEVYSNNNFFTVTLPLLHMN